MWWRRRRVCATLQRGGSNLARRRLKPWQAVVAYGWIILVLLIVMWALGMITSYTLGGFIHILLVVAIAMILIRIIQGTPCSSFIPSCVPKPPVFK